MIQVIGAGFGRTGTHSLAIALDRLGFGPCYTIFDMDKHPSHREMWQRPIGTQVKQALAGCRRRCDDYENEITRLDIYNGTRYNVTHDTVIPRRWYRGHIQWLVFTNR